METIKVIIGGDVCPTRGDEALFGENDAAALLGGLAPMLRSADLTIVNLECVLTTRDQPILKSGPALRAHPDCTHALKAAGVDLVCLANNHAFDFGPAGLKETIEACRAAGLETVGTGPDLEAARKPVRRSTGGRHIGVVAMAERDFGVATEGGWGVSPLDPIAFTRFADAHRADFDRLIVLVHGGYEGYPYASPEMRNVARFLVERGADAVVFQHSHCAGHVETYRDRPIVYGQGNFIFNYPGQGRDWHEGFLVELTFSDSPAVAWRLIPFTQSLDFAGARPMDEPRASAFLGEIARRAAQANTPRFIEDRWAQHCAANRSRYLDMLLARNRWTRALRRLVDFDRLLHTRRDFAVACNVVRCESHREALLTTLEQMLKDGKATTGT